MPYYRTCPRCGCNLDPGERCDCMGEISTVPPWKNDAADPERPALPIRTPETRIPKMIPSGRNTDGHKAGKGGRS